MKQKSRTAPCLPNTLHQHITQLRARIPESSSDLSLLCVLRTAKQPFYTANHFKGSTITIMSTIND